MLAFKPEFIRTLWYTLLTTTTPKNQLSISILSKGLQICKFKSSNNFQQSKISFQHLRKALT